MKKLIIIALSVLSTLFMVNCSNIEQPANQTGVKKQYSKLKKPGQKKAAPKAKKVKNARTAGDSNRDYKRLQTALALNTKQLNTLKVLDKRFKAKIDAATGGERNSLINYKENKIQEILGPKKYKKYKQVVYFDKNN